MKNDILDIMDESLSLILSTKTIKLIFLFIIIILIELLKTSAVVL